MSAKGPDVLSGPHLWAPSCQLRLRACWVTQAAVGRAVQPARKSLREDNSMKKITTLSLRRAAAVDQGGGEGTARRQPTAMTDGPLFTIGA